MKQIFITSNYSQGTQVAIQQDHALKEMFLELSENKEKEKLDFFLEYCRNHKTTISLGCGMPSELEDLKRFLDENKENLDIVYSIFKEPEMNYTTTCLTMVYPEKMTFVPPKVIEKAMENIQTSIEDLKKESIFYKSSTIEIYGTTFKIDFFKEESSDGNKVCVSNKKTGAKYYFTPEEVELMINISKLRLK